jgi:hypothetical protein
MFVKAVLFADEHSRAATAQAIYEAFEELGEEPSWASSAATFVHALMCDEDHTEDDEAELRRRMAKNN